VANDRWVADEARRRIVALLIGAFLAFTVGLLATTSGLDRDRGFYPTVTIVIASYYALFAVMGASTHALVLESLVGAVFLAAVLEADSRDEARNVIPPIFQAQAKVVQLNRFTLEDLEQLLQRHGK
jgi:hypothetical protein